MLNDVRFNDQWATKFTKGFNKNRGNGGQGLFTIKFSYVSISESNTNLKSYMPIPVRLNQDAYD